jgi:hypothetical protein
MTDWQAANRFPGDSLLQTPGGDESLELTPAGWVARSAGRSGTPTERRVQARDVLQVVGPSLSNHIRAATLRRLFSETERLSDAIAAAFDSAFDVNIVTARAQQVERMAEEVSELEDALQTRRVTPPPKRRS